MRQRQKGFSLVELMIVVGVVLVISSIAIPIYRNAMDGMHLSEAARNYAGMLQRGRLTAVTNNTYNAVGVQFLNSSCPATCDLIAYTDTADTNVNPPSAYATPEPMVMLGTGVSFVDASVAPATADLLGKVFPNHGPQTLGYPPVFGSRGLPCNPVSVIGGTVCNTQGLNAAFATYFQSAQGKWEAVSVNPVGRIQLWSYDANAAAWNQL
jgi:prepilin-type N-terminal cleavage/methylation domain-containing protein